MMTFVNLFAAAACLLGLASGSVDGEKWSEDGDAQNGEFGLSYYQDGGRPSVVFYSSADAAQRVYCLRFEEQFETSRFASGDDFEEVSDSEVDYGNVDWAYALGNASAGDAFDYRIYAPGAGGAAAEGRMDSIEFVFRRTEVTTSAGAAGEAVKFDINIDGYTWAAESDELNNASFVIAFKLEDCSDEYADERVDSDEQTDDAEDEADEADEPARKLALRRLRKLRKASLAGRRRLAENDGEEDSGDSHEFDLDLAFFTVAQTATAEGGGQVNVDLFYGDGNEKLYVRFDYFGASVELDPTAGTRSAGSTSGAHAPALAGWAAALVALVAALAAQ